MIIVNGFQPLTIITKHSILDVTAALDPPLSGRRFDSLVNDLLKDIKNLKVFLMENYLLLDLQKHFYTRRYFCEKVIIFKALIST